MSTMQSFYASLSSDELRGTYLKILADLTQLNGEQIRPLESNAGWQTWGAEKITQPQPQA